MSCFNIIFSFTHVFTWANIKMSLSIVLIHRNSIVCTRHKSDDRMTIRGALYKVTCDAGRPQKLQRRAERCEIVNKFVEIDTNK